MYAVSSKIETIPCVVYTQLCVFAICCKYRDATLNIFILPLALFFWSCFVFIRAFICAVFNCLCTVVHLSLYHFTISYGITRWSFAIFVLPLAHDGCRFPCIGSLSLSLSLAASEYLSQTNSTIQVNVIVLFCCLQFRYAYGFFCSFVRSFHYRSDFLCFYLSVILQFKSNPPVFFSLHQAHFIRCIKKKKGTQRVCYTYINDLPACLPVV